jgi:hypothetical protein
VKNQKNFCAQLPQKNYFFSARLLARSRALRSESKLESALAGFSETGLAVFGSEETIGADFCMAAVGAIFCGADLRTSHGKFGLLAVAACAGSDFSSAFLAKTFFCP